MKITEQNQIKKEIEKVDKQIDNLNKYKDKLQKQLIKLSKSPIDKFKIWWESDRDEDTDNWIPSNQNFPKLRKYLDKQEFNRYETVDLSDFLYDEFAYAFYGEDGGSDWTEEDKKLFQEIGYEMMKGKLKSFKYDW